jgi:hypothetical protein
MRERHRLSQVLHAVAIIAAMALCFSNSRAEIKHWTNATGNSNMGYDLNWNPVGAPTDLDTIVIDAGVGYAAVTAATMTVARIVIPAGGMLVVRKADNGKYLTVRGDIVVEAGGSFTTAGSPGTNGPVVYVGGNIINYGLWNIGGVGGSNAGFVLTGANQVISGTGSLVFQNLSCASGFTIDGTCVTYLGTYTGPPPTLLNGDCFGSGYQITATVGAGGNLSPAGTSIVNVGGSQTYTIIPDSTHIISDVLVDSVSVGAVTSYLFSNVTADHMIQATFAANSPAVAGKRFVPSQYGTIQVAVDAAEPGDTVIVAPGLYIEAVTIPKHLWIFGPNDGKENSERGLEADLKGSFRLLTNNITIGGFTVIDGTVISGERTAFWIDAATSGHTLRFNILEGTRADICRGFLFGYNTNATRISRNEVFNWTSGAYINPTAAPDSILFEGNTFRDNFVGIGSDGINNVVLTDNRFTDNSFEGWGYSDVEHRGGAGLMATGNTFERNGCAIRNYDASHVISAGNNFWGSIYGPKDTLGTTEVPDASVVPVSALLNRMPVGDLGDPVSENVDYNPWVGSLGAMTAIAIHRGWNLLSLPREPATQRASFLFPPIVEGMFFAYNQSSYIRRDSLEIGPGYWGFSGLDSALVEVPGTESSRLSIVVPQGMKWALVGSVTNPLPVSNLISDPPGSILPGSVFVYSGVSYSSSATLEPGRAYWIFVTQPCVVTLRQ